MINKLYTIVFAIFILGMFALNIINALCCGQTSQIINLFNVKGRTNATILLMQHIVFESGIIMKDFSDNELDGWLTEISAKYNLDVAILKSIASSTTKFYGIYSDGTMGVMRINSNMITNFQGKDPFIPLDNIEMAAAFVANNIDNNDILSVFKKYFNNDTLAEKVYNKYLTL